MVKDENLPLTKGQQLSEHPILNHNMRIALTAIFPFIPFNTILEAMISQYYKTNLFNVGILLWCKRDLLATGNALQKSEHIY